MIMIRTCLIHRSILQSHLVHVAVTMFWIEVVYSSLCTPDYNVYLNVTITRLKNIKNVKV